MTEHERALIDMAYDGILRIDPSGLVWRLQKKHKEWGGYQPCTPKLLGHETSNGYIRIGIRDAEGVTQKAQAHRLVFMYFHGDIPEGLSVNHKNGEKQDNRIENLELMTPAQQMRHAIDVLGRKCHALPGERRSARLSLEDYASIKVSDAPVDELALQYAVTTQHIRQIQLHWRE